MAQAARLLSHPGDPGELALVASSPRETNQIAVWAALGYLYFYDSGAALSTTASHCGPAARGVRCVSAGVSHMTVRLGERDDEIRIDPSVSSSTTVASALIDGGAGRDLLIAAVGAQTTLTGGTGDDTLTGGSGPDTLFGGPGADTLHGGAGNDRLYGGDGTDILYGGTGDDLLWGEIGGDLLEGNAGSDALDGGVDDDSVTGGPGPDTLAGGFGVDLLGARDGSPDAVACAGSLDLAIVDPIDDVKECDEDHTDDGHRKRPELGESARATPVGGTVELRLAGADRDRFYPLHNAANIPLRSALDASEGVVRVTTTKNRGGAVQDASFSHGKFSVHQAATDRPVTEFRLAGGNFAACSRFRRGRTSALVPLGHEGRAPIRIRRLRTVTGHRKGAYRIIGLYATAAPDGTTFVTEDRCGITVVTRVKKGTVLVRSRRRGGVVRTRNGRSRGPVRVGGQYATAVAEG